MNVGFIGVGKLGMACAETMASKHTVTGYDIYPRESSKIKIATRLQDAVEGKELVFIAVQTPHDPIYGGDQPITHLKNKDFDYSIVNDVLRQVNEFATPSQLVVLISTVLPGTTRRELKNNITNARFIYNPYLIAMGSVEWDMVNPEMVIIGTEDGSETGDAKLLTDFYKTIMENNPRYVVGTWDEAECIKVFYNTFISAKIGLVNMIQDVAIKQGNIDVDVVTDALAASTMRIMGPKYMTAGMGDAGPCHPRDNIALRYLAENLDLGYDIFDTIMKAREKQAKNMARYIYDNRGGLDVYIHGKAYKPGVAYLEGSYSLLVGYYLQEMGITPTYIDPLTEESNPATIKGCVLLAHNQVVTYGYSGVTDSQPLYCEIEDGSVVIDPWRKFTTDKNICVVHYGNTRPQ
ncbi:Ugd Predicted UDP-glucose 6-dehydrogenase [uncultured Caudovirales phage]|uniref:Ugd Predicted UDP-glucose 6-dehydrogenase n=1 Tax=uncultured Caudovirales phage TaxID=2100421 RepID=A0A6J5L8A7_9CAUD|nr:Ugd Predicted UDP-glucose 6-dehydrogenase [uncultured Caudovirales phage]